MQLFSYYKPHISSYISCFIYNSIGFANSFFQIHYNWRIYRT